MNCDLQPAGETNWQGRAVLRCTRCPNRIAPSEGAPLAPLLCRGGESTGLGLGDLVAGAIHVATLGLLPECAACRERRERLNKIRWD